ncbi:hypothetical protein LTR15_001433 [Elasticomyces elasticus]|nr:hypothetical protein LTR15_001433 [Elasticomyces elasticus]
MPPKLEKLFTLREFVNMSEAQSLGSTKGGAHRGIYPVNSGFLEGEGIHAEVVSGGGDMLTLDPASNTGYTDTRVQLRSTNAETGKVDAMFFVTYRGILKLDEKVLLAMTGSPEAKTTSPEDHYCFMGVSFEVSEERHKWMEQTFFVGHGHVHMGEAGSMALEYDIYKLS